MNLTVWLVHEVDRSMKEVKFSGILSVSWIDVCILMTNLSMDRRAVVRVGDFSSINVQIVFEHDSYMG